jgi:2-polyprenyl-3-methyl-5-hydroxy-6-metoxy-1,4-benzoquinol methylase
LQFDEDFFSGRKYALKERLIKRHVLEVVKWASTVSETNLLNGKRKRALDVGCAYGYSSKVLETLGYETCGVDISTWGLRIARMNSNGQFLACDAQTRLPFRDATFDLVTCFDVLEHLKFPEKALQNILETCADVMLCTTPNQAVEKPVRKITGDFDETHISAKSASEWEKTIRHKSDLRLVKVETFLDLTARISNRHVFFRSFKVPNLGLTVRILVRK